MAIHIVFAPHNEATAVFEQAKDDILIISPTIKSSFMDFVDKISVRKGLKPRLITSIWSESGTRWDRERSFSDYPELLRRYEDGKWEIRIAKFNLRAYCIDRRIVVVSTVNPSRDGQVSHNGLWIIFDDPVSSSPFVQLFDSYWCIAEDLRPSQVAEVLKEKGQEIGPFLELLPDQVNSHTFVLAEEATLDRARVCYETSPSDQSLKEYLHALEPFDKDGRERIKIAERHVSVHGGSVSAYQYLAHLYCQQSNYADACRTASEVLAKNKDDMDMVSILIIATASSNVEKASNMAMQYTPEKVSDHSLLMKVASVIKASLNKRSDKHLANILLKAYRRLYEVVQSGEKYQLREEADELAKQYGWKLGW